MPPQFQYAKKGASELGSHLNTEFADTISLMSGDICKYIMDSNFNNINVKILQLTDKSFPDYDGDDAHQATDWKNVNNTIKTEFLKACTKNLQDVAHKTWK